jgi:2-phosphoglycerate kinase
MCPRGPAPRNPMTRRLLLVGGSAGSGKSTVARSVASQLGAGWLQLDTVWVALKAAAGPGTAAYDELAIDQRMADENDSDEAILAAHIAAAEAVCHVLPEVFAFELATHGVLVVDGAWLMPSFVAGLALDDTDIAAIYLQHTSPDGVATALAPRLAGRARQARHVRMDRRIWQYGGWLAAEARRHGFPVLDPLPFETLDARVVYALGVG